MIQGPEAASPGPPRHLTHAPANDPAGAKAGKNDKYSEGCRRHMMSILNYIPQSSLNVNGFVKRLALVPTRARP
jgi:hypothetical protein